MARRGDTQLTPALVSAVENLLDNIDEFETLDDKLKVIDRGLKLDGLRLKANDDEEGSALDGGDDE